MASKIQEKNFLKYLLVSKKFLIQQHAFSQCLYEVVLCLARECFAHVETFVFLERTRENIQTVIVKLNVYYIEGFQITSI